MYSIKLLITPYNLSMHTYVSQTTISSALIRVKVFS